MLGVNAQKCVHIDRLPHIFGLSAYTIITYVVVHSVFTSTTMVNLEFETELQNTKIE